MATRVKRRRQHRKPAQPPVAAVPAASASNARGHLQLLDAQGRLHVLPHRVSATLHLPADVEIIDPRFSRQSHRYMFQAALATLAMLAVLFFVDSLADAALAAGLASSVVILFLHPTGRAAKVRSVVGGHGMALVIGSAFAIMLALPSVAEFLAGLRLLRDLALALSVGTLILIMAITDTEHPPAAGTVIGMALKPWALEPTVIIIGAVLLLAVMKRLLNPHLRDLI